MADAPAPKKSSGKKVLGQSYTAWGLELGGAVVLFLGYRYLKKRGSSTTTTGTGILSGGNTVPVAITSTTSTVVSTPTTFSAWVNAALGKIQTLVRTPGFSTGTAYDAITAWQNGQCVSSHGYAYISGLIGALGLPPDGINYPLSVCKTATTPAGNSGTTPGTAAKGNTIVSTLATKTFGDAEYYALGTIDTAGNYIGQNVGTGAPVLWTWTGNGTPTLGAPPAGVKGLEAWTPTSTPAHQIGNPATTATGEKLFTGKA